VRTTDRLLFSSNRDGGKFHIYSMTSDGADVQRVGHSELRQFYPAISPDGGQIAFAGIREEAPDTSALFVMNADGSDVRKLAEATIYTYVLGPRWSPDGKRIAFYTYSPDGGGNTIHVVDRDGRGLKKVAGGSEPVWSPDGAKLIYSKLASEVRPAPPQICCVDLKTGEYRTLVKGQLMGAAFSADGMHVAYLADSGAGRWDLFVAGADFTNPRQLTRTEATTTPPQWSADSRSLYFSRIDADAPPGGDETVDIFALDIASGEERQLTEGQGVNAIGPASTFTTLFFGEPLPPPR
jgi:Tol biopolymer transport system component